MLENLLEKFYFILFFMSLLNVIRHVWNIFLLIKDVDKPNKYEISNRELIFLGLSISYILTTVITIL
jgi:hypothetical protein